MRRATPFLWYGSKSAMVEDILSLMPPHKTYVEPFGGSAAVLLAKPPSPVEIYNDKDNRLCDYFRLVKDPEKARILRHHLEFTPYSRAVYDDYVERFEVITDEIERAVAFTIIANQSFNGKFGAGWKCSTQRNCAKPFFNALELIETVIRRFQNVQVENRDFGVVLVQYDSPTTLFLLDPPYVSETRVTTSAYRHEMSLDDHRRMLGLIKQVKGMVMLCGYAHPLYDEALVGWERHEKLVYCKSTSKKRGCDGSREKYRTEVIWMNPQAAEARPR
jgi:DNA adenine methylase